MPTSVNMALVLRGWEMTQDFWHTYEYEIGILDYYFQDKVVCSTHNKWSTVIKKKDGQAHTNFILNICMIQRDQFVCPYLLSKLWYYTQVLTIT